MPIACSTSARRSAWQRLNARWPSLSRSSVERFPKRPPAEHGLWIRDRPSNTSDDPQQPAAAGRRRGMPDGQLSAATIEYEDIGEPGITGPNRREGRNRIKQEAAYATGTDQQKAPGGGRSLALPAAQAGAPPGPARPRRRSSQGPAAEVASMSTQIQPAPARAPTSSAGPTCHRPRPAAREASVCSVVPHRAGVVLLLPDRIGRGASGHRARHRLAGRAMPGRRLLRPCG
jgi:hypothetical protein